MNSALTNDFEEEISLSIYPQDNKKKFLIIE